MALSTCGKGDRGPFRADNYPKFAIELDIVLPLYTLLCHNCDRSRDEELIVVGGPCDLGTAAEAAPRSRKRNP
jgi:hypothetical protein